MIMRQLYSSETGVPDAGQKPASAVVLFPARASTGYRMPTHLQTFRTVL